jgi:hypothetical protein
MGAPRTAIEGLRLVTEFHTKETQSGATLVIEEGTLKHEVYIYGCKWVAHFFRMPQTRLSNLLIPTSTTSTRSHPQGRRDRHHDQG